LPELALIAGTRGMLARDWIAGRASLNQDRRKAAGWTLLLVGAISTIPLALQVLGKRD
jgi:hypothetical protein